MPRKRRSKSKTLKVKFTQKKVSNRLGRNLNTAVGGFSGAVIGSLGAHKVSARKAYTRIGAGALLGGAALRAITPKKKKMLHVSLAKPKKRKARKRK